MVGLILADIFIFPLNLSQKDYFLDAVRQHKFRLLREILGHNVVKLARHQRSIVDWELQLRAQESWVLQKPGASHLGLPILTAKWGSVSVQPHKPNLQPCVVLQHRVSSCQDEGCP